MLIGASQFSAAEFSSPAVEGIDPRRLVEAAFSAGGGFSAKLAVEYSFSTSLNLGGELEAPFVRFRRTSVFMRGILGQGVAVSVSPVMVTLDGGGGVSAIIKYDPARVRCLFAPGGGFSVEVNMRAHARAQAAAGGGVFARLAEYQKFKTRAEGGGNLNTVLSRKQYLESTFTAGGGLRISPWYELIGAVDTVIMMRPFVAIVRRPISEDIYVLAIEPEDIIVLEVGI